MELDKNIYLNTEPYYVKLVDYGDIFSLDGLIHSHHPYDEQNYYWARLKGGYIIYCREYKIYDKQPIATVTEFLETDEEYFELFEKVAQALKERNAELKPKMCHN